MSKRASGLAVAVAVVCAALLSACAPQPEFETPIEWEGAKASTDIGDFSTPIGVRLDDDGQAWLTEFPQGVTVADGEGSICLERSGEEPYTGPALWSSPNEYRVELEFGESRVTVALSSSRFGGQDWTELKFRDCGGDLWVITHKCGETNYRDIVDEPCSARAPE